jgi:hypothetical protein
MIFGPIENFSMSWGMTTKRLHGRKYLWNMNGDGVLFALLCILALLTALVAPLLLQFPATGKNLSPSSGEAPGRELKTLSVDSPQ